MATKQTKECGLFELMCDIVLHWAEDHDIDLSVTEMNDLRLRLNKAQQVLDKRFVCKKASICIEL